MTETIDNATKVVGITGGIGSGKSTVTDRLKELGYIVIDADEVAREAAVPGEPAMIRLREELGDKIFLEDGNLDRPALAKLAFGDQEMLKTVNEIFHKDILQRIESEICRIESTINSTESGNIESKIIFISAPLLFESGADKMTDEVWLVTADEDIRISRVMDRDCLSESDVRARIKSQMPEDEKRRLADVVIENNGTPEQLYQTIDFLLGSVLMYKR